MPLYFYDGGILQNGGSLAASEDCCCEEPGECENCTDDFTAGEFDVEVVSGMGGGNLLGFGECSEANCDAQVEGVYTCPWFSDCNWIYEETPHSGSCTNMLHRVTVTISQSGSDYVVQVEIRISIFFFGSTRTSTASFSANLGPTKPNCSTISTGLTFIGQIDTPGGSGPICDFSGANVTVTAVP